MAKPGYNRYVTLTYRGANLTKRHRELIARAQETFGHITPCGSASDFRKCFSRFNGRLIFWFNSHDGSTHIVKSEPSRSPN